MSENPDLAPMRVSVVGPQWVQAGSTSRGTEASVMVETADVGLLYLDLPILLAEPHIQVGEPTVVDAVR